MSRIYFHTEQEDAEVRGSERAWLGQLCSRIALAILDPGGFDMRKYLMTLIPPTHYMATLPHSDQQWIKNFETVFSVGDLCSSGPLLRSKEGKPLDLSELKLNTAFALGSDPVKLAARIHGQCEIHCYAEGSDRAWLAGIIESGLQARIYRKDQGWDGALKLVGSSDDGPVVLSYSVCDQFPTRSVSTWKPTLPYNFDDLPSEEQEQIEEEASEAYYDLPDSDRWAMSMEALRNTGGGLRLDPANWGTFFFGDGVSVLDLI